MGKSKYQKWLTPEGLACLRTWEAEGISYEELRQRIGVSDATLRTWRKRYPEFGEIFSHHKQYQKWLTPEGLETLKGWAAEGLTMQQIAERAGISPRTLRRWEEKYPEIPDALSQRRMVDFVVENACFRLALGGDVTETREVTTRSGKSLTIRRTRHIPGSVAAMKSWLCKRRPEYWK